MSQHEAEDLRTALGVGAERRAAQGRGVPLSCTGKQGGRGPALRQHKDPAP